MKRNIWGLLLLLVLALGCKKNDNTLVYGNLSIRLSYSVDGKALIFDSAAYTNKAGNRYSVERLTYYLSDFRFYNNKKLLYEADSVVYCDARNISDPAITFPYFPNGTYDSVTFNIGVDPYHNVDGGLPATLKNDAMIWPDPMGGGYHFIRLEGHWLQGANTWGYTVHLGQNPYLVVTGVKTPLHIQSDQQTLNLEMNVNEWFCNPHTYNFNVDGVYTMGIDSLMRKIAQNGTDVFSVK